MIQRRTWNWVDWAFFGTFLSWFVLGTVMLLIRPDLSGSVPKGLVVLWAALCFGLPILFWRPGYSHTALFPVAVLLTVGSLQIYISYSAQQELNIIALPLLIIGYLADRYNIWWTFPIFVIGFPLSLFFLVNHPYAISTFIDQILSSVVFFGIGLATQRIMNSNLRMQALLEENIKQYDLIREQNQVLEQYAEHVEKLTLLEERNRLARELHDTVGHTFTSVIIGMDAVVYLLEAAPDKAREKLEALRNVTRSGLEEVRRSIHQIAPPDGEATLAQQLTLLANEFALHTGTQVRFRHTGVEQNLPKQITFTLIRCLQEALTNAKRHGQANRIDISLACTGEQIALTVEDDGVGTGELQTGFGLTAMRERIEALQGSLGISSVPGAGTIVRCLIPFGRG